MCPHWSGIWICATAECRVKPKQSTLPPSCRTILDDELKHMEKLTFGPGKCRLVAPGIVLEPSGSIWWPGKRMWGFQAVVEILYHFESNCNQQGTNSQSAKFKLDSQKRSRTFSHVAFSLKRSVYDLVSFSPFLTNWWNKNFTVFPNDRCCVTAFA